MVEVGIGRIRHGVVREDAHVEALAAAGERPADPAKTDDPDGCAPEPGLEITIPTLVQGLGRAVQSTLDYGYASSPIWDMTSTPSARGVTPTPVVVSL